tara:strand:- start:78 stop:1262 length:1185 start_codon:yes stop_codon:yes gene_type:complete
MYITKDDDLTGFCSQIESCKWLAIDTEFVREKTYFHNLGLIQVSGNGTCAAIDPLSVKNLSPILEIIKNPSVLKVFHAGKQDLEILYRLCREKIYPVFDTQIAASLLGWGTQISFARVVHKTTGKRIYKNETYTDWCRRPLSSNQIEYALDDVRYLEIVYEKILVRLKKLNRLEWLDDEFHHLEDTSSYQMPDPRKQFMKIKNIRGLRPQNLAVMVELSAWREEEAARRNCHPKTILRDEPLLEIARSLPKSKESICKIRGINFREVNRNEQAILKAIEIGLRVPKEDIPGLPEIKNYNTHPGVEELIAAFIQSHSEELQIDATVLADRKQIHEIVKCYEQKGDLADVRSFRGWRRELIGSKIKDILEGRVSLSINPDGKVSLTTLDSASVNSQ